MRTGILFDLDGTLLDTLEDLHDAVNHVMRQFHYPERTLEEVRLFVGNGARRLMDQAVPEGVDGKAAFEAFQPWYREHCQIKTRPYDGISEVLENLKKKQNSLYILLFNLLLLFAQLLLIQCFFICG